jgi:hypothetical protein
MNTAIETNILENLHRLDERHQAEVLNFVEYLAAKTRVDNATVNWPSLNPAQDLARFAGKLNVTEDAVAYQRRTRDGEWA